MGRKSIPDLIKWRIIGISEQKNTSITKIARIIGVSRNCVRKTLDNFKLSGQVKDKPRIGRPKKFTSRDESFIFKSVRKNSKLSLRNIVTMFHNHAFNKTICAATIKKILDKKGIGSYIAVRKPLLSVMDRIKRRNWAKTRLNWTIDDWNKIIFTDESNFEMINRKGRVFVKRLKNEKYLSRFCVPRVQGGGGSLGIWGCFSGVGTGCCHIFGGRMNQQNYMNTLENYLFPSVYLLYGENSEWILQHDGAPAHRANSISSWLIENNITVLPWCPRSPDLNPIENIWAWIQSRMVKARMVNLEEFKQTLHELWLSIPNEMCTNLINSMPKRVLACYRSNGGHFKY
jgi:transposase